MMQAGKRRVVVTGVGAVSALGSDVESFWQACLDGRTVVESIPQHWHHYGEFNSTIWSPLPKLDFDALGFNRMERGQHDPVTMLAVLATREALAGAGFASELKDKRANTYRVSGIEAERAGVAFGTGIGGASSFLANYTHHCLSKPKQALTDSIDPQTLASVQPAIDLLNTNPRFNPFVVSMLMPNAPAAYVGVKYGFRGASHNVSLACASGIAAVGHGFRSVRDGYADMMVVGGAEYLDDPCGAIFRGFDAARTLTRNSADPDKANRPFDEDRAGFLFSQGGAATLIVEELEVALSRGASPLAEIVGYAETFDSHSMMSIAPDGMQIERMMRSALADANVDADAIDYVNAHGTGTRANDGTEAEVIGRVFGARPCVNSTKSLMGHTLGASGAFEAVVAVLSLYHQTTHACRNLESPIADLNWVQTVEPRDLRYGISQSFAFGGHNSGAVFKRWTESA